jgi:hypothetical protein
MQENGEETRETEKTMQERKKGGTSKQITQYLRVRNSLENTVFEPKWAE